MEGAYAGLLETLKSDYSAPGSITEKAVYDELRKLFGAHGKDGEYAPIRKEVLRVLTAVGETVPDAIADAGAGGDSTESAWSSASVVPSTGASRLRAGMRGVVSDAAAALSGAAAVASKVRKAVAGQISRLKLHIDTVRVPAGPTHSPAGG